MPSLPGLLLGTAIGDALGQPLEGHDLNTILHVDLPANPDLFAWRFVDADKGACRFRAGETSDDTQLTLAMRDALADVNLDTCSLDDFMKRVCAHHLAAYGASTKGWGPGTVQASRALECGTPWQSSGGRRTAGNGVLMKLLPLVFAHVNMRVRFAAAERERVLAVTRMTHGAPEAAVTSLVYHEMAARLFAAPDDAQATLASSATRHAFFSSLLDFCVCSAEPGFPAEARFSPWLARLLSASAPQGCKDGGEDGGCKNDMELATLTNGGTSYCLSSLSMVCGILLSSPLGFSQVARAAFIGGDTDSNAAMVGGIVGALLGVDAFPDNLQRVST